MIFIGLLMLGNIVFSPDNLEYWRKREWRKLPESPNFVPGIILTVIGFLLLIPLFSFIF